MESLEFYKEIYAKDVRKYDSTYCWETMRHEYLGKFDRIETIGRSDDIVRVHFEEKYIPGGEVGSSSNLGDQIRRTICKGNKKDLEEKIEFHKKEIEKLEKELSEMSGGRRRHKKTRKMRKTRKN
jgi:hypothetical protein